MSWSMLTFLGSLGAWNWFILAVALFTLETIVPGVHFLWFGIAAVVVGIIGLLAGIAWPWQLIGFALVSLLTVFWVRRYAAPEVAASDQPDLNVRGAQYLGRTVAVEEAIVGGRGKVRVGDTVWPASGQDVAAGARVKIVGADGTVLKVARVD